MVIMTLGLWDWHIQS